MGSRLSFVLGYFILFYTENYIDGTVFLGLSESEIKEMVPPIGLAKKIMKLVPKVIFFPNN